MQAALCAFAGHSSWCGVWVSTVFLVHLRAVCLRRVLWACVVSVRLFGMTMIPPPKFCTAAADVLVLLDLCFHIVRCPGAGDFGVVLLAPGHFQIDCGWVGQGVSCRGVS